MKLYDLLYPEKQVGKIQDVHLCNITKIILFNFGSLENYYYYKVQLISKS